MREPGHPHIRLATEYGHIIGLGAANKLTLPPAPAYGQEPAYIPFETAGKQEEPVHTLILLTWKNAVDNKLLLVPYADMAISEIDEGALTCHSGGYDITIRGDNLKDWAFLDALVKHRVKSMREWNPALHNRPNAAQLCLTRISWQKAEPHGGNVVPYGLFCS
jgi:hypothetical protein